MKIQEVEIVTAGPDLRPIIDESNYNKTMFELGVKFYKPYYLYDDQFKKYLNVVLNDFTIKLHLKKEGVIYIKVYKGFTYDFASVPEILRGRFPSNSREMVIASLVHDVFFSEPERPLSLESSNDLFYQLMRKFGVNWFKAKLYYWGVCTEIAETKFNTNILTYGDWPSFCQVLWLHK